jgi:hypothetical protein
MHREEDGFIVHDDGENTPDARRITGEALR